MAEVTLPQLGETVTEGTITRWFKKVGDTVAADEPLFEVSTDKVDTEVPSPVAGVLTEIRVPEGETVPVGAVIGVVGDAGAVVAAPPAAAPAPVVEAAPAPVVAAPVVAAPAPAPVVAAPIVTTPAPAASTPVAGNDNRLLSPVVRRLVTEHNLNVDSIAGTGPGGRITREDGLDHIDKIAAGSALAAAPAARPAAVSPAPVASTSVAPTRVTLAPVVRAGERDDVVPLSKIRQLTGAHMTMSLSVSPHAFSVVEVDYANVDNTRAKTKDEFKSAEGFSLTYPAHECEHFRNRSHRSSLR